MANNDEYLIKIFLDVQGDPAMNALIDKMKKLEGVAGKGGYQKAMKGAAKDTRAFGRTAANAGYQLQDFFVQVGGGVDVSRALSQQLPQLFIGFGVLGSALGVVAAVMPMVIDQFTDAEEISAEFSEALADLNGALSATTTTIDTLDFNSWNEQWNKASESVKKTEIALLEFRNTAAQAALDDAVKSLSAEQAEAAGRTWGQAALDGLFAVLGGGGGDYADARGAVNLAETLGIDAVTATLLQETTAAFEAGTISVQELRDQFVQLAKDTPNAGKEFYTLVENVVSLAEATDKLAEARKQAAAAGTALSTGSLLPVDDKGRQKTADDLKRVTARGKMGDPLKYYNIELQKTAAIYKQLYPDVVAYAEATEMLDEAKKRGIITETEYVKRLGEATKAYEESLEGFSAADEILKTFDQSFNTMLDGVLMGTQDIAEGFKDMAKVIIAQILKIMAYQAIIGAFGGASGGGFGETFAKAVGMANAKGNAFSNGNVIPFARGGVVNGPTLFPMAKGMGLMGEAGPEAVMPLTRGKNGNLGVAAPPMNVTVNNMASGVKVNARQTESGLTLDVVLDQIGAAIAKGGNPVANALESSYSLGRGRAVY